MIFFQPDYVKNFKCDGQSCGAQCCKRWIIDIDAHTLENYKKIESPYKEITSHIKYNEKRKGYVAQLDEKNYYCAFLGEDNLCTIQKKYGEKFLSVTCQTFPRVIISVGSICERSLTLTCPIVAGMALLPKQPIIFEFVKEAVPYDSKIELKINDNIPTLTIDQRLAVLGIYFDNLEEHIFSKDFEKIAELTKIFTSQDFFMEEVPALLSKITFKPKDFIRTLFANVLENLYGKEEKYTPFEEDILDALKTTLELNPDKDGNISIKAAVDKFISLSDDYENFVKKFSTILENYLVYAFFSNMYPWRLPKSIRNNYGVFITAYKILELSLFSLTRTYPKVGVNDILRAIIMLSVSIGHTISYLEKISESLNNIVGPEEIISTFLQTKGR